MEIISFGNSEIIVQRRSGLRSLSLSVFPNGQIVLRAAKTARKSILSDFISSRESWLKRAIAECQMLREQHPPKRFQDGEHFPFLGEKFCLRIRRAQTLNLKFSKKDIHFFKPEHKTPEECIDLLKKCYNEAGRRILARSVEKWSNKMGLHPRSLHFRQQKSIWGSCSPDNKISLNWKLIVAPQWVIDYVVIHELAHIKHKNHSKRFWSLVEQFTHRREDARHWLRENHFLCDFLSKKSELWP